MVPMGGNLPDVGDVQHQSRVKLPPEPEGRARRAVTWANGRRSEIYRITFWCWWDQGDDQEIAWSPAVSGYGRASRGRRNTTISTRSTRMALITSRL
ncbi:hypothetical protein GCM10010486_36590 [Nonomuraea roseoviolacea subsp. carminata]